MFVWGLADDPRGSVSAAESFRDVFDIYTIIFLALAVFIFLRLRSVLGQRTGRERPPYDPYAPRDAVRGATAMGWIGFNCSLPHKVALIELLDELAESARLIGAVNCAVRRNGIWIGENTDGQGVLASLRTVADPA